MERRIHTDIHFPLPFSPSRDVETCQDNHARVRLGHVSDILATLPIWRPLIGRLLRFRTDGLPTVTKGNLTGQSRGLTNKTATWTNRRPYNSQQDSHFRHDKSAKLSIANQTSHRLYAIR